jgi:4-amino-4-deoxy-L-arabinose transferase-like glycosyltransferase
VSEHSECGLPSWFRWALLAACLAAGLFLRLHHLTTIPPGFHPDEAMDAHLTVKILNGQLFLYTPEGWGREGMYYYLAAPLLWLTRDGILGMRLTSALIGMVLVGLTGFLVFRLFGPDTGVLAMAWMSLTFWPVFASRVAVRNLLVGPALGLAMWAFWRAWQTSPTPKRRHLAWFGLAGLLTGLCFYTHQSSRVIPLIYVAFLAYAALFHRPMLKANWRGLLVGGCALFLVSAPLIAYLHLHPGAEGTQRAASLEPLMAFLEGDPGPLWANALAVLKMFTIRGDPLYTYNIPYRPVFPGLAAIPFYLGAFFCLCRWRDPAYALMVLWLVVMLIPTLITVSAPLFLRSTGALIPTMTITALGLATTARFLIQRWGKWGLGVSCLLTILLLGQTAWLTQRDYARWGALEQVKINYYARETAIAHYLRADTAETPMVAGSRFSEDIAPFIVSTAFVEEPPPVRWVLPSTTLAFPAEQPAARFILVANTHLDDYLARNFLDTGSYPTEVAYEVRGEPWLTFSRLRPPAEDKALPEMEPPQGGPWFGPPGAELPASPEHSLVSARLPVEFQDNLALLQYGISSHSLQPGEGLRLVTLWRVLTDGWPGNVAMFAHITDARGQVITQQDQFGYPAHSWQADDLVVQVHDLALDPAIPPGRYWLQIGFYERHLVSRWPVTDQASDTTSDRLLLEQVEVRP